MHKYQIAFRFIFSIIICQLAGLIGSIFTTPNISTWYTTLTKPHLSPPNFVFGPVWTLLFILMGIALFRIWQKQIESKDSQQSKEILLSLKIFFFQLLLNIFWSILFFGFRSPSLAFIEIIVLWISILLTIIAFAKIDRVAAYLLIPYILWVTFASYLNYMIWMLNN